MGSVWPSIFIFPKSLAKQESLKPGAVYQYEIALNQTANLFGKRHRIRLEIASSNFPCYDRNPNNGEPLFSSTGFVSAGQTVYHDREHPSRLILNVMSDTEM
ncbi:CocE/NonD family hydrolase C-terminal non-catalytic domain-containing protein [candidate division KSB1 bacterium]